ncbi:E3 ubiquitin-protein ligase MGRN1 [Chelonia mydas]|uniref:E3 ubiquitin-protein ligase n=1 Tax=Chelonia mydas TaxID=8469 RepID=M7BMP2_CHEMY|nr:E3 ubiquitin-protein ligase MGRN1 [Chelonia mydas]
MTRDYQQCRVKVKELQKMYQKARKANNRSSAEPQTCCSYKDLFAILGGDPTTTPSTVDISEEPESQVPAMNSKEDVEEEEEYEREMPLVPWFENEAILSILNAPLKEPHEQLWLNFDLDRGVFPVVIQAVVDEGDVVVEVTGHAHVLLAAFEKHVDGSFSVKPLKQKQIVDRVSYLLQEIYGIENKNNQETKPSDDENSDNSNECVVCLSDLRDTLILPCRHLCLCNSCADTLRYQANNCPICRLPFRALLQIRAVRKKPGALSPVSFSPVLAQTMDHDEHSSSDNIPPGYEPISLLEALNGLRSISPSIPSAPLYEEISYTGVVDGLPPAGRPLAGIDRAMESGPQKSKRSKSPDSALRSPSSPIHEEDEEKLSEDSDSQPALSGAELVLRKNSSPGSIVTEEMEGISSLQQGSRLPSMEDILPESSCSEHRSLTRSESDPPVDVYLPGSNQVSGEHPQLGWVFQSLVQSFSAAKSLQRHETGLKTRRRSCSNSLYARGMLERTLKAATHLVYTETLKCKPDQGEAFKLISKWDASNHFLAGGGFTRFADLQVIPRELSATGTETSVAGTGKIHPLADTLRVKGYEVQMDALIIGALGTWDPCNERLLWTCGIGRRYARLMRHLMVSDTIR